MKKDIEVFTNYVDENYDINNNLIKLKYDHSLRVSNLMIDLALRFNLSDDDVYLAFIIGLCHDLGRFKEVECRNKFDNLAFDHAACSDKILFNDGFINNFNIKEEDYPIVKKAIYFHNKKDIDAKLNERESLFAKMIRDMDKLDIIDIMIAKNSLRFDSKPNKVVLRNFFLGESIDLKDLRSRTDSTILYLSFLKNLNFYESQDIAIERRDLNKIICGVRPTFNYLELYNHLTSEVYNNQSKIKKLVQKK